MPKLIRNAQVQDCTQTVLEKDAGTESISANAIAPLELFLANSEQCLAQENSGVWIDSDEGPEALEPFLDKLELIAINFPKFVDGRGYSYARLLRERFGFKGEIRAIGDVLHDQLFYMKRCGFDAFAIRENQDAQVALAGLSDFTESYQTGVDKPAPLYRRRA